MPTPCPSCHKLCSLENSDPEVNDLELNDNNVTVEVRQVRTSACCGDEMKEVNYSWEQDHTDDIEAHIKQFHPELWDAEADKIKDDSDMPDFDVEEGDSSVDEGGGGRYAKNMITTTLSYTIVCNGEHAGKDDSVVGNYDFSEATAASGYDELN